MVSKKLYIFLFFIVFMTSSCEEIVNNLIECSIKDLQLKDKVLKQATVNQSYYEVIKADIKNDSDDDAYYYSFTYTGTLPEGITASSKGTSFELRGIATESGVFPFQVNVYAEFGSETASCHESTSKSYTLVVK